MNDKESKPQNPCTLCMKHSGVEKTLEHHKEWLDKVSGRVNAIIMLLLANLALLAISLTLKQ